MLATGRGIAGCLNFGLDAAEPRSLQSFKAMFCAKARVCKRNPWDWLVNKTGAGGQHDIYRSTLAAHPGKVARAAI